MDCMYCVCTVCVCVISQWSWWLYWERWPSPPGPAGHWPVGRTSSSQHWWLTDHKRKQQWKQKKKWKYIQTSSDRVRLHHLIHFMFICVMLCYVNMNHTQMSSTSTKMYYEVGVDFWPFLYRKYDWVSGEQIRCHRLLWMWKTTEPRDSPTHHQQHSLSVWMMNQLDSAASVCHHLPTSNHDGGKKSPRLPTTKYSCIFSHPCEHEQTPFSITKKFLGQMLISHGSGFRSWKNSSRSFFLSLSLSIINPSILQLKPSLCLLYFL